MAATDQTYRNQYGLDIVFAVSSILMLFSIVWMLVADFEREYKVEQRIFRDVEMAMAQREALLKMPRKSTFDEALKVVEEEGEKRKKSQPEIDKLNEDIRKLLPQKDKADLELANLKADLDSETSFFDIAVEHHGLHSPEAAKHRDVVEGLIAKIGPAKNEVERITQGVKSFQRKKDEYEQPLTKATGNLKKVLDDFDRQVAVSINKKWGLGDDIRSLWFIEGYASPMRIEQITLNDLTIDYTFKGVTRFDRCTTCHKGIARGSYTKENLQDLWYAPSGEIDTRLKEAHAILAKRKEVLNSLDEGRDLKDPKLLTLTPLSDKTLNQARITEFCAHPRLDLFVGANSKHPAEKFGCTSCHSGQPSGTSFTFAAHTPNNYKTQEKWKKEHGWEAQHMWDFPMLPQRFVESSCLKCHHQVTDLYSDGNKSEAPKLTKGYNVVREFGCFGCHEINGYKGGRQIGPDLRLEPNPPVDKLTVAERAKLFADPDNPPGTYRKVGPSLFRVVEKTYPEWALKWIMAPREFRPDTKMPHYYGLSNNDHHALEGTGQEEFPTAEVHGIVHYLFKSSAIYLDLVDDARKTDQVKEAKDVAKRLQDKSDRKERLSDEESKQLQAANYLLSLDTHPPRLNDAVLRLKGDANKGRDLFTKKGCLACHSHAATNEPDDTWPAAPSEADFGPNLTQVKEKLVSKGGDNKKAVIWLVNWVKNPNIHSPRTKMPITHLSDQEAADIAAWLLAQDVPAEKGKVSEDVQGPKWASMNVKEPSEKDLEKLARVYLDRTLADFEVQEFFAGKLKEYRIKDLGVDERDLAESLSAAKGQKDARKDSLLNYVGRKAIGRLGCFGCHDIPGFDSAKPIGTALADWGKKDPTRLAFEDIVNYVDHEYKKDKRIVDSRLDKDGYPQSVAKGPLYEQFYYDLLVHKSREGYLHQKLLDPRSYDYGRIRAWDDRSRMPQFQFARLKKKPKEEPLEFNQRKAWAEAVGKPLDTKAKPRGVEPSADFAARKELEDADNREAAMVFVLGLVGDPIPLQYLNQPGPDRLAVIKGRQVLDRYNCAGCHVVRPGVYEFKMTKDVALSLEQFHKKNFKDEVNKDDFFFPEHGAWNQPIQIGDVAFTHGVRPLLNAANKKARVNFVLTDALKLAAPIDGKTELLDFRSKDLLSLPTDDLIWPPRSAFQTPDTFKAWEKQYGSQGGAFAALLGAYLKEDHPEKTKYVEPGPFVPPLLTWQGERVQPDWLFQFLLDPQKVREQTVLRMPKFNMSEAEARALVDYFAGIEKQFNPEVQLVHPYPKIPQRAELDSEYWQVQTANYVKNLKKNGLYDKELAAVKPVWNKMRDEWKAGAKLAEERLKTASEVYEKAKKEEAGGKDKDDKQKAKLKKDLENAELDKNFWDTEKKRLENLTSTKTEKSLEEDWAKNEAYALAGYRLVVNQCNKCHAVGNLQAQQVEGQGPSLNISADRLRPDWSFRWIANPQRFVPYVSAMPAYFKHSDKNAMGEDAALVPWLPGTHYDQIGAARDVILNLPRISELPMTRYWMQSGAK